MAVPEVIVALPDLLALDWVEPGEPTPDGRRAVRPGAGRRCTGPGAPAFGADLARLHRRAARRTTPRRRAVVDVVRRAPAAALPAPLGRQRRARPAPTPALVEQVIDRIGGYGGDEPPARIHGDLWPGNVLWGADGRVWLVDPAAHGGHRETDLAQLALFGGAPHLDRILAAYREAWPLAGRLAGPGAAASAASAARAHGAVRRRLPRMRSSRPPVPL